MEEIMKLMFVDKDGIVLDQMNDILEAFADVLEPCGISRKDTKEFIFENRGDSPDNQISQLLKNFHKRGSVDKLVGDLWKILGDLEPKPYQDALDCIPRLYENEYTLIMSTGFRTDIASKQMKRVSLRRYFDMILGDGKKELKKGDIHILKAKERYGLRDEDLGHASIVGDGVFEIKLGKKFGLKTFGIARNYEFQELRNAGADEVFSNLYELCNYLNVK